MILTLRHPCSAMDLQGFCLAEYGGQFSHLMPGLGQYYRQSFSQSHMPSRQAFTRALRVEKSKSLQFPSPRKAMAANGRCIS